MMTRNHQTKKRLYPQLLLRKHGLAPYIKSDLSRFRTVGSLRYETGELLTNMVEEVVSTEGPVHRSANRSYPWTLWDGLRQQERERTN